MQETPSAQTLPPLEARNGESQHRLASAERLRARLLEKMPFIRPFAVARTDASLWLSSPNLGYALTARDLLRAAIDRPDVDEIARRADLLVVANATYWLELWRTDTEIDSLLQLLERWQSPDLAVEQWIAHGAEREWINTQSPHVQRRFRERAREMFLEQLRAVSDDLNTQMAIQSFMDGEMKDADPTR